MQIDSLPKLASLPQWLLQVSNLGCFSIELCYNLKALPEKINAFQSLRRLQFIRCPLLTSSPEEMRRLASLTQIFISGCPELERCQKKCRGGLVQDCLYPPHIYLALIMSITLSLSNLGQSLLTSRNSSSSLFEFLKILGKSFCMSVLHVVC